MILLLLLAAAAAFLVYASANIRSGIYLKTFSQGRTKQKVVALTFDDGPHPQRTPAVLRVLQEAQTPACFFCIGSRVTGNEALVRRIVDEGHLVGNHTQSHSNLFPLYPLRRMEADLQACHDTLSQATGGKITLFRPPFGVTNPTLARAIRRLGYTPIGWNIRTRDTLQPPPEKILRHIRRLLRPGSVILLHDRMPGSDRLLRQILDLLREEGYRVVRLDELMSLHF